MVANVPSLGYTAPGIVIPQDMLRRYFELQAHHRAVESQLRQMRQELIALHTRGVPVQNGRFRMTIDVHPCTLCRLQDVRKIIQHDEDYQWFVSQLPRGERKYVRVADTT